MEFVGIPGINPDLDIAAVARVRRTSRDPLDVRARVTGSLIDPRVELSSDEAAISESDLLSYLVFGRPTAQLASREAGRLQDVGEALLGDIAGAASSVFSGTVAARLSALAAQQWGLDYFSINQLGEFGAGGHYGLEQTQVEVGRYLGDDLFWVLVAAAGLGLPERGPVPGLRSPTRVDCARELHGPGFLGGPFLTQPGERIP